MTDFIDTDARNPGPGVLGHDPVVAPRARGKVRGAIEETGVVDFRDEPLLPFIKNPKR